MKRTIYTLLLMLFHSLLSAQPINTDSLIQVARDVNLADTSRLMAYYKETAPLVGFYHVKKLLRRVDGMASIEDVNAEIKKILSGH